LLSPSNSEINAAIVRSFCSAGVISSGGYRPSSGIDSSAARNGAMSLASSPERAIISSSLSSLAAVDSPFAISAACQIWVDIG
jgi:hypothetical protein